MTARAMRILLKGLALLPVLIVYLGLSGAIRLLPLSRITKQRVAIKLISGFAHALLALFRVSVHVNHRERLFASGNARLVVANHLSYVDVLVLSSLIPSAFVTSVELKNTALLGALARLSGSIFVERRRPSGLKREIEDIAAVLNQGIPVALFPEGTTSNGDRVHAFKNSLFDAAVVANADIIPVCIRYTRMNNEYLSPQNRNSVYYFGGVAFPQHFLRFLSISSVDVEVNILRTIHARSEQSRKDLALETHQVISEAYHA